VAEAASNKRTTKFTAMTSWLLSTSCHITLEQPTPSHCCLGLYHTWCQLCLQKSLQTHQKLSYVTARPWRQTFWHFWCPSSGLLTPPTDLLQPPASLQSPDTVSGHPTASGALLELQFPTTDLQCHPTTSQIFPLWISRAPELHTSARTSHYTPPVVINICCIALALIAPLGTLPFNWIPASWPPSTCRPLCHSGPASAELT
jgi:hypothetical protein